MESPIRSRVVLAFVIVVVCSVWMATGQGKPPTAGGVADGVATVPKVEMQGLKPAHQSVALGALNRTAPVLGD